ncbi:unnamed protein product [Rhizoctonia solani]|uniref:Uncharacterized protein n=1 Tax=Rhizoctonia solani TaxID=456999 RepID=A0A8H3AMU2_9AGAM|nr:unnamed protein product [Rhizoctonia solani]
MLEVTEIAVAAVTVAVGAAFYFGAPKPSADGTIPDQESNTKPTTTSKKSGKKNKKKTLPGIQPTSGEDTAAEEPAIALKPQPKEKEVTPKPEVPPTTSTAAKKKKKKSKAPVPGIETTLAQAPAQPSASAYESSSANDGAWTRVETRRKDGKNTGVLSDGLTTSVTGTEDEADERVKQRTLAERMLPAGRKTGVEDMLETPQYPDVARVMRVKPVDESQPAPAPGYSWGDYEDADENKVISMDDEETDEGGWGVVKSRKPKRSQTVTQSSTTQAKPTSDPSAMNKKQRQNAAKRDASKTAKAEAEEERQAKLAAHKRALEREKIAQAYAKPAAGKGKASGGMTASVNDKGSLVWD